MALSSTEQQQIRTYLGYPDTNLTAVYWLNSAMGQVTTDTENAIRSILGELTALDAQLQTVRQQRLQADKVENIAMLGPKETLALRKEGARLCNRIGVMLGTKVKEDIYSSGGGGSGCLMMG